LKTDTDAQEYIHPQLGREITAIGGHYLFGKEVRLTFNGRDILYFVGYAVLDSTCCGVGGTAYALVPGYIQQWKYKKHPNNAPISLVAPILNQTTQKQIRKLIQKKEMVFQVTFC